MWLAVVPASLPAGLVFDGYICCKLTVKSFENITFLSYDTLW